MLSLHKLWLIIKREYLTRVRKKTFLLTTFLIPIGFAILFITPIAIQYFQSPAQKTVAIIDQTDTVYPRLAKMDSSRYRNYSSISEDSVRQMVIDEKIDGYLKITDENIKGGNKPVFYSTGSGGLSFVSNVKDDVRRAIQDERIDRAEVPSEIRSIFEQRPELATRTLTKEGKAEESHTEFLFLFGFVIAMVIYFAMFIYGAVIMRSVIEEKSNRIIEVITSSVKPIELMLGKVIGVGALGLTQFIIWIVMGIGLRSFIAPLSAFVLGPEMMQAGQQAASGSGGAPFQIPEINPMLWVYLLVYFLLGYLIYSGLFTAVGSAVDSESETQQLIMPITIPIVIAILLMPEVASSPDSTLAVVSSLIPLFSPILMVGRLPITDVPLWQIGLSFVLMTGTFVAIMALSAKIYRVGILMYGKKASLKEMWRWMRA
jgi:ABC-2 type transport system permease protein